MSLQSAIETQTKRNTLDAFSMLVGSCSSQEEAVLKLEAYLFNLFTTDSGLYAKEFMLTLLVGEEVVEKLIEINPDVNFVKIEYTNENIGLWLNDNLLVTNFGLFTKDEVDWCKVNCAGSLRDEPMLEIMFMSHGLLKYK